MSQEKEFGGKPFVAEVIDMDRKTDHKGRLSNMFTDRMDPVIGMDIDDPAARFLFEDTQAAYRHQKRNKYLKTLKTLAASLIMGGAGAWIVWMTPGMGPHDQQFKVQQAVNITEVQLKTLETQLAQAQIRLVELTKTTEIQKDLLNQGEAIRRSMAVKADETAKKLEVLTADSKASQEKLELIALRQDRDSAIARNQSDSLNLIRQEVVKIDGDLAQSRQIADQKFEVLRIEGVRKNREELRRFSNILEAELAAIKSGDLNDVKGRVERLAEHVWQEVGRLDGRIVRASGTRDSSSPK
jgi:vacuolar-type H+-ATPase subunit I/STV1